MMHEEMNLEERLEFFEQNEFESAENPFEKDRETLEAVKEMIKGIT